MSQQIQVTDPLDFNGGKPVSVANPLPVQLVGAAAGNGTPGAALDGTDDPAVAPATGAVGIRGWLSTGVGIYRSLLAAIGTPTDAAWGLTGAMTLVSGIKTLTNKIVSGVLAVSQNGQWNVTQAGTWAVSVLGGNTTAIKTDGSATTQPVSATALPLPAGAATSALQPALNADGGAQVHLQNSVPAGEAHIGEVGGNVGKAQVRFGPGSSTTYATGQAMSAAQRLDGMARVANGTGLISSATLELAVANTAQVDLVFFTAVPTGAYASGTTFTLNAADAVNVSKVIHLVDWTALGAAASLGEPNPVPKFFRCDDTTNTMSLWVVPVARGSITLASATDATLTVRSVRN